MGNVLRSGTTLRFFLFADAALSLYKDIKYLDIKKQTKLTIALFYVFLTRLSLLLITKISYSKFSYRS